MTLRPISEAKPRTRYLLYAPDWGGGEHVFVTGSLGPCWGESMSDDWMNWYGAPLGFIPTHFAELPNTPEVAQ